MGEPMPPQGQADAGQGESPAQEAVENIQQGFQQLGQMLQSAGGKLPPSTMQLFQKAVGATDAFLQDLTGGGGEEEAAPEPKGPMPANASKGSAPAPNQGY